MNEADFLSALRTLPLHSGARGLRDDCALIEIGGETLIFNHDLMAEGTHFRADADLADVAWKLVAINLSDLASKGAEPVGVLLGHALSGDALSGDAHGGGDERFLDGLRQALTAFDVPLMGGDTVAAAGPRTYSMTAIGRATCRPVPSRSGAQPGDGLYVTGMLGRAMLGFEGAAGHLDAFNRPRPLLTEGRALAPLVTAMMDVSDGLLLDAFRLAKASEISISIETSAVPVADPKRAEECMRWGDDYELLFTLPPDTRPCVEAALIGRIEPCGFAPLMLDGHPIVNADGLGYQHG